LAGRLQLALATLRKHVVVLGLTFLGLAGFAAFAGWAVFAGSHIGGGWRTLGPVWPYVAGGAVVVAALAGVLMWLAFYSANHGYDEPYDPDQPEPRR
jgi:4-hydroxybenzoate polyprenyltransferase